MVHWKQTYRKYLIGDRHIKGVDFSNCVSSGQEICCPVKQLQVRRMNDIDRNDIQI